MAGENILVFDADPGCRGAALTSLTAAGFHAVGTDSAGDLAVEVAAARPELVVIEWHAPGVGGMELIDAVRRKQADPDLRVLIVSQLGSENDIVAGLEVGADDYLPKPYASRELVARVNALLRGRRNRDEQDRLRIGSLLLDRSDNRVYVGDTPLTLCGAQLRLLTYLMLHRERALRRAHLLDSIWGQTAGVDERTVDVNIRRLRSALAVFGIDYYVQTIRGLGYRLSTRRD
jgi:two-component system phosphate regulon response regulator PhoB